MPGHLLITHDVDFSSRQPATSLRLNLVEWHEIRHHNRYTLDKKRLLLIYPLKSQLEFCYTNCPGCRSIIAHFINLIRFDGFFRNYDYRLD